MYLFYFIKFLATMQYYHNTGPVGTYYFRKPYERSFGAFCAGKNIMDNNLRFAKGMGVGMVVGSAIGMSVAIPKARKKIAPKKSAAGQAFKAVGTIAQNIGNSLGM